MIPSSVLCSSVIAINSALVKYNIHVFVVSHLTDQLKFLAPCLCDLVSVPQCSSFLPAPQASPPQPSRHNCPLWRNPDLRKNSTSNSASPSTCVPWAYVLVLLHLCCCPVLGNHCLASTSSLMVTSPIACATPAFACCSMVHPTGSHPCSPHKHLWRFDRPEGYKAQY